MASSSCFHWFAVNIGFCLCRIVLFGVVYSKMITRTRGGGVKAKEKEKERDREMWFFNAGMKWDVLLQTLLSTLHYMTFSLSL